MLHVALRHFPFSSDYTCLNSASTQASRVAVERAPDPSPAAGLKFLLRHFWVFGPHIEGCSRAGFTSNQVRRRGHVATRLHARGSSYSVFICARNVFCVKNVPDINPADYCISLGDRVRLRPTGW